MSWRGGAKQVREKHNKNFIDSEKYNVVKILLAKQSAPKDISRLMGISRSSISSIGRSDDYGDFRNRVAANFKTLTTYLERKKNGLPVAEEKPVSQGMEVHESITSLLKEIRDQLIELNDKPLWK